MYNANEADILFKRLDLELMENIDAQYFSETRDFRSLNEVLEVLSQKVDQINRTAGDANNDLLTVLKDRNPAYSKLLNQRKIVEEVIEDVVKFQHGGLNNSVDTMSEVVREYTRGRDDIQGLRKSLAETQAVLTAKKVGQVPLKELWQKKVELQETLRMVKDLESLKSAPHRVQRLMQQKRYLTAVNTLNKAITTMFGEDLVGVRGLSVLREQLMDLKEGLLETCVGELKSAVVASGAELMMKDYASGSDSEDEEATADNRSGSGRSHVTSSHINDEVRSIVSRSAAGGPLSSAHSLAGSGPGSRSSDAWPVDLRDLDESLETSLGDPSEAGSLYIRLLVKTIGVLECEEDVERMVLDGVVERFKETCIHQVREHATAKLEKELARERRSAGGLESTDENISIHTRLFTSFMGSLLDCTLQALRRMLYLLKLLYVSKAMRSSEGSGYGSALSSAHIDAEKHLKDHNKRLVLSVWMGMEDLVVQQMLTHLVEPDVQGISDSGTGRQEGLMSKYGSQNRDGFMLLEKGDDEDNEEGELDLIFTPSARHAAPIFRRIVSYAQIVARVMRENALEDARLAVVSKPRPLSIIRESASPRKVSGNSSEEQSGTTSILDVIQAFLEDELIPVIQSTVNHGMREIQMNNAHFSVVPDAPNLMTSTLEGAAEYPQSSSLMTMSKKGSNDTVPLCYAAQLCFNASKPLFSYWLQLHLHRSMVCTVLDRLIRGFSSAARDELEGLTYNCVTVMQENMHSSLVQSIKLDPLYKAYRMKVFGSSKTSVDDLFGTAGATGAAGDTKSLSRRVAGGRRSVRGSYSQFGFDNGDQDELKGRNALEVVVWEQLEYWDVGSHNYPVTSQKIVKDFSAVGTIASISYACDWLIKRLSGFTSIAARKITHAGPTPAVQASPAMSARKQLSMSVSLPSSTVGGAALGGSGSRQSVSALMRAGKGEVQEHKQQLINTVVAGARELSKIAEEGMALLRGELQLICFYFLHRLAHIVYAPPSALSLELDVRSSRKSFSGSSPLQLKKAVPQEVEGIAEEEAILSAFTEHLTSFLQAVSSSTSTDALAALLSPLCTVIPRILTHCAMHMVTESDKASSDDDGDAHSQGMHSEHYLKSHLLRMVVSAQQAFALQTQSFAITPETKRRLTDLLTDGFERSRRFITMFGMPAAELKSYLKSNVGEYSKEEVEILWIKSTERDVTFMQLWKELETVPRTGPKASVALQFAH